MHFCDQMQLRFGAMVPTAQNAQNDGGVVVANCFWTFWESICFDESYAQRTLWVLYKDATPEGFPIEHSQGCWRQ